MLGMLSISETSEDLQYGLYGAILRKAKMLVVSVTVDLVFWIKCQQSVFIGQQSQLKEVWTYDDIHIYFRF